MIGGSYRRPRHGEPGRGSLAKIAGQGKKGSEVTDAMMEEFQKPRHRRFLRRHATGNFCLIRNGECPRHGAGQEGRAAAALRDKEPI